MNLRTCPNCSWQVVGNERSNKCPICKTNIPRFCKMCGSQILPGHRYCNRCKKLRASRAVTIKNTVNAKLIDIHNKEWNEYKSKMPTESQPLNIVMDSVLRHYRGCAICKGPVETYFMIVKPLDGGVVNDKNMWPLCEKCFDVLCNNYNPIIATNYRLYKNTDKKMYLRVRQLLELD